jgi:hypothetical protein
MTAPEAQRAPQMEPAPGLLFPPELLVSGAPLFATLLCFSFARGGWLENERCTWVGTPSKGKGQCHTV